MKICPFDAQGLVYKRFVVKGANFAVLQIYRKRIMRTRKKTLLKDLLNHLTGLENTPAKIFGTENVYI